MKPLINFDIKSSGNISKRFREINILNFNQASIFVTNLKYGRNSDKNNLTSVFTDSCGTCSTKHALLKELSIENNFNELKLILGLVKMNAKNTPEIATTLKRFNLDYIPEAHNYLKFNDTIFDYTKPHFKLTELAEDLILETEILPKQITDFKVEFHKKYLLDWIIKNKIDLTLDKLWKIREQCIKDLGN